MRIKPLNDDLVVEIISEKELKNDPRNLDQLFKCIQVEAKVIAAGPGKYNDNGILIPNEINEGDFVLLDSRPTAKIELDGKDYFLTDKNNVNIIFYA